MCLIAGSQGCVQQRLNFQVRPDEMSVSQTARFYIYGKGAVSKSTFEDPHFRTMTQAYYVAGGGSGKAPYLTRHGLVKYLDAEFALMLKFTKFAAESLFEYACGNGFVQNLHDGATLQVNSNIPRICVSL